MRGAYCGWNNVYLLGLSLGTMVMVAMMMSTLCAAVFTPVDRGAGDAAPLLRFGVMADVQYADQDARANRYYRSALGKLRRAVAELNKWDLDFTIQLGDAIDKGYENLQPVLDELRSLRSPLYHVLGNHDFDVAPEKRDQVVEALGMKRRYYDFVVKGTRFVVLDGNDLSFHATAPETARRAATVEALARAEADGLPQAEKYNGGLAAEQMRWFHETLNRAGEAGQRVVVFCHFPVYPEDKHNLWNASEVVNRIDSSNTVSAYFAGHNHAGNYAQRGGAHYVTIEGMVDTPDENAFAVVELYEDHLEITGFARATTRRLALQRPRR